VQDIVNKTEHTIDSLSRVIDEQKGIKKIKGNEKVAGRWGSSKRTIRKGRKSGRVKPKGYKTREMKAIQDQANALQDQEQMQKYAREKASKLANADLAWLCDMFRRACRTLDKRILIF
jgi:hypothetical protein